MAQAATRLTAAIIARTLFSNDPRLASTEARRHIETVVAAGQPRLLRVLGLEGWDMSPSMIRLRRARRYLRETLEALVRERGTGGGADDFFGGLIRAFRGDRPGPEADALAVDNAITFYVAGHETTATALTWATYLLAAQPQLQEDLRAEAQGALGAGPIGLVDRVPLLRCFLDETLRLYPPVVQIIREAAADDDMCGQPVRKGELVFIYPWVLHRHRALWDRPDSFDPTRFAPERAAGLHRFQFLPFGAGPRVCVGARFATVEALVILAHWLGAARFRLPPDLAPMPGGTITLRPRDGMPLIVEPLR
jgi:cytochrome P450